MGWHLILLASAVASAPERRAIYPDDDSTRFYRRQLNPVVGDCVQVTYSLAGWNADIQAHHPNNTEYREYTTYLLLFMLRDIGFSSAICFRDGTDDNPQQLYTLQFRYNLCIDTVNRQYYHNLTEFGNIGGPCPRAYAGTAALWTWLVSGLYTFDSGVEPHAQYGQLIILYTHRRNGYTTRIIPQSMAHEVGHAIGMLIPIFRTTHGMIWPVMYLTSARMFYFNRV